jgi:hypothetical protein
MKYDNLTVIRDKINAFSSTAAISTYAPFATTLSTELNTLSAPAWNVVLVYYGGTTNYDAVLYGYGFNGHWFWFNRFQISLGFISLIVWKDFNCIHWYTYDSVAKINFTFKLQYYGV